MLQWRKVSLYNVFFCCLTTLAFDLDFCLVLIFQIDWKCPVLAGLAEYSKGARKLWERRQLPLIPASIDV